jgi:CheY-like chemotaxis protein
VDLSTEWEPGEYRVEADPARILEALNNLVSNSCDAMPDGGALTIELSRVKRRADGDPSVLQNPDSLHDDLSPRTWVCLSVADTGTGMTEEVEQHLFEPFFTTKEIGQGTGLGLAQVHGIVQQHGGFVDVETELGVGTTVRIFLPALGDALAEPAGGESAEDERPTVLLVEPSASLRHAERELLESLGYHVLTAKHGREALAISRSPRWSPDRPNHVDLVLTTVELPGTGGIELVSRLRKSRPGLKAVAVSDRRLDEAELRSLQQAGFADAIPKPLEVEQLERMLRKTLEPA